MLLRYRKLLLIVALLAGCRATPQLTSRSIATQQNISPAELHHEFSTTDTVKLASYHEDSAEGEIAPVPPETEHADDLSVGSLVLIETLAMSVNPTIQRAEARLEALRGKHLQAGLPPNPTAGIIGDDINEVGSPGRYGVFFGRQIVRGNKLGLSQSVVCAEIKSAELALAELRQRLMTDVRLRYYDLLVAIEKVRLADQLVELSENATDATAKLLEAKELARTALLQSTLELQNAQVTKRQAANELGAARRNLAVLIGEEDLPFESFTGSLDEFDGMDIESSFDRIVGNSPEISRLFAEIEVARRNLARQCVEPVPNWTWQANVQYGLGSDDVVTAFQVGMPVPILNRNEGAICQARQEIVAAERNAERKALQLRERLVAAYQKYVDAKLQVEAFKSEILPTSTETIKLVAEGYRQGEVGFLELLVVQRTFFNINLANIEQQREMWRQRINIEGMLLSGSLSQQ